MRLYFVRHGESTANLLREFSNSGSEHPLTAKGAEQARALASSLSDVPIERVYSSPVIRAVQTAQTLADSLHAPLELTEALREWNVGIYEGTTDPVGWKLHAQVQDDWFVRGDYESRMPGGESYNEIRKRFVPLIESLVQEKSDPDRNVALVGHGGLYTAMLPAILKNITVAFAREHGFPYTAVIIAETRLDGLRCISWCGIPLDALV